VCAGGLGGLGRTTPSVGAGTTLPSMVISAGMGCSVGPDHGCVVPGGGVGWGGVGWVIVEPGAGGSGRLDVGSTWPASEGAVSTRGTPMSGSPSRSTIVFGMDACECHWASMP